MDKMVRFGKCNIKRCKGEITHGSWGTSYEGEGCDALGFCKICFKEYPLEFKGKNMYLTLKESKR